ncbi:monooxygenase 1 [Ricinus communis]|uniref:monooxygenase 1 n=1 Tax=Ricinus communis TaxID=3988 RepID=UPI00201A71F8|nr:monooxygenase 1 [Ricinus communis]
MDANEEVELVIVGGGICGLATALALHRKGIRSVVLERSETLRAAGAGIAVLTNGWRALDELGVGSKIRPTALPLQRVWDIDLDRGKQRQAPVSIGEARCVKRSDLIEALADDLPLGTIRFGCDILSVNLDPEISFPILQLSNGSSIKAKALIGCDGANSVVSDFLELKPKKLFSLCAVRGFTHYPNGHGLAPELIRMVKGNVLCGRVPVDDNLVFWFIIQNFFPKDTNIPKDPELMRQFSLESTKDFPTERLEMVKNCEVTSLSLTHLRYRTPWEIYLGKFRRGTATVAGDAMHIMGPFIGQGGSAAIEDAVVLARCLSAKMQEVGQLKSSSHIMSQKIGEAFDDYVKERRMRLVWLSTQTYLYGSLLQNSSRLVKVSIAVAMIVLFGNPIYHTRYDCGPL